MSDASSSGRRAAYLRISAVARGGDSGSAGDGGSAGARRTRTEAGLPPSGSPLKSPRTADDTGVGGLAAAARAPEVSCASFVAH